MGSTTSFFLGPRLGRWTPSDWVELAQAIADGTLNETSWVELKSGLADGKDGNVELGRDLASLALRSGLLVLGVREKSRGVAGDVCGVDLARTRDRVDQVARNVASPPIYVECREIPDPDDPQRGVLLVGVPASGPHMVDERYWGRGDTGKTRLSDPEVREYLARRQAAEDDVLAQVRALERALPRPHVRGESGPPLPRLYLRAVPTAGRRDALLDLLRDDAGGHKVHQLLADAARGRPGPAEQSALDRAHWWARYAQGQILSWTDPTMIPDGRDTVLRLEGTGALDLLHAPVGDQSTRQWGGDPVPTLHTGLVLSAVHDALGLLGRLADQRAAYPGPWIIAVRVDALEGRHDWRIAAHGITHYPPAYTGALDYEDVTTSTTGELVDQPWAVTGRLLARLVYAVGAERVYLPYEPGSTAAGLAPS
jgi:hypothetical protein